MFFNAVQSGDSYDRTYTAEDFSGYLDKIVGDGVFASPSVNLQVIANNPANMAVYVHAGQGWIQGHKYISSEPVGLNVAAANGVSTRYDSVNFYIDYENRVMGVRIVTGTAGQANPPALVQTSSFYEYRLAKITVGAGVTTITQANITDCRGTSDCPFVAGLIDQIDAATLFAQWNAQFNAWFNSVQSEVSELQGRISGLQRYEYLYTTPSSSSVSSFDVATYIPQFNHVTDSLELYISGLHLSPADYTLSGTTVTLTTSIFDGADIDIVVYHVVVQS